MSTVQHRNRPGGYTPSGSIRSIETLKAHFEVELTGIFLII